MTNPATVRAIRVHNAYSDGHESTIDYTVNVTGNIGDDLSDDVLEPLWDLLSEYTGDGHGTDPDLGWCYSITITDATDARLIGLEWENCGN